MSPGSRPLASADKRVLATWAVLIIVALPWSRLNTTIGAHHIELGLLLGITLALAGVIRTTPLARTVSRYGIQACVVMLGLRTDLNEVARGGILGVALAAGTIAITFALGATLGRALRVERKASTLVSSGTAICGGSAIAAVSSVIAAPPAAISVATGTVFLLNATALLVFPWLGIELGLSPRQFGTWAGVAIHDVSSVVGAAQSFAARFSAIHGVGSGAEAIDVATVVKLSRVLWLVPVCLIAAAWYRRTQSADPSDSSTAKTPWPWFVGLFVVASAVRTFAPGIVEPIAKPVLEIARSGMAGALFLIGAGLSLATLRAVGWRALVQGIVLWLAMCAMGLAVAKLVA